MRPKPSRVRAFRNCFGTIWSVSRLTRSIGATKPVCEVKGCMLWQSLYVSSSRNLSTRSGWKLLLPRATESFHVGDVEVADVDEVASDGGGGGHDRADQVRSRVA